jgi:hypothetical protein
MKITRRELFAALVVAPTVAVAVAKKPVSVHYARRDGWHGNFVVYDTGWIVSTGAFRDPR